MLVLGLFIFLACSGNENKGSANDQQHQQKEYGDLAKDKGLPGYKLLWGDDFDSGELDAGKWKIEINGGGNGNAELQYYRAENVSVGKDPDSGKECLILTAQKESFGEKAFTSGRINTFGKFSFRYGRIDASIKIPQTANGLWPAFWMMGDYYEVGWPKCGEIDIMEMGNVAGINSNTQDRYFNGACHWGQSWNGGAYPNMAMDKTLDYSLQDGEFHLWTMIWDENSITQYVDLDRYPDREPYFKMTINSVDNENSPGHYFHKPYHILFNLAVGGHFTGLYQTEDITALNDGNGHTAKMYVDYVRVYQPEETN